MWGAFIVIVVIAFSIAGTSVILKVIDGGKECKVNSDCKKEHYCGSDFGCHQFPSIENTIVKNDWTKAAAIIGLSIVFAALILRKKQQTPKSFY